MSLIPQPPTLSQLMPYEANRSTRLTVPASPNIKRGDLVTYEEEMYISLMDAMHGSTIIQPQHCVIDARFSGESNESLTQLAEDYKTKKIPITIKNLNQPKLVEASIKILSPEETVVVMPPR